MLPAEPFLVALLGEQQVPVAASANRVVEADLMFATLRRAAVVVVKGCTVT